MKSMIFNALTTLTLTSDIELVSGTVCLIWFTFPCVGTSLLADLRCTKSGWRHLDELSGYV